MAEAGDTAPDFTLPRDGGDTVTLSDHRSAPVVLFFYPRDDTSGCTKEALAFTTLAPEFAAAGAKVFGISKDTLQKHEKFRDKHALTVPLLSDAESEVCEAYGVWKEKKMYGKAFMGIERTTVLIDAEGKIARLAEGKGARSRRRGSGRGPRAVTALSLSEMAVEVLSTPDGRAKTALSRAHAAAWFAAREAGTPIPLGHATPPDRPARPENPRLLDPRDVPRRKPGSTAGRTALLHAVAHIELNAVDLHWDIIPRFANTSMPLGFYDDWVKAADEESKHFNLMCDCLEAEDSYYGALDAHAGMWRAAEDTAEDFMGRLAVVPMVLEARGLDVTPGMIAIFEKAGATQAVEALRTIYAEEVAHVAYGSKWFHFLCGRNEMDPKDAFHELVQRYFHSTLKPPFNEEKRAEAGLPPDFYWPLAGT